MLVQFKSESYGHVDYLESVASKLLKMMQTSSKIPSALSPEQIDKHLHNLRSALAIAETDESTSNPDDDTISMRTRAKPLIDLLQSARDHSEFVMWDRGK